jgi:hypothetical protein
MHLAPLLLLPRHAALSERVRHLWKVLATGTQYKLASTANGREGTNQRICFEVVAGCQQHVINDAATTKATVSLHIVTTQQTTQIVTTNEPYARETLSGDD